MVLQEYNKWSVLASIRSIWPLVSQWGPLIINNMYLGVFSGAIWYYMSITGGQYRPLLEYGPKQAISQYGPLVSQYKDLLGGQPH